MAPSPPLHAAIVGRQPGKALLKLLKGGEDPNARDESGLTALHIAARVGNIDAITVTLGWAARRTKPSRLPSGVPVQSPGSPWDLLTAGAPGQHNASPLHTAAAHNGDALRLMLCHSSVSNPESSFLGIAIGSKPQQGLLDIRDSRGRSLLHYAVETSNIAALRILLQYSSSFAAGAAPNPSRNGNAGSRELAWGGSGLNPVDNVGHTPLHLAALLGHAECARLLLKAGADQSCTSHPPEGALPVHLAASCNHTAVADVLFRHANASLGFRTAQAILLRPNAGGLTALHVAALHNHVDVAQRLLHLVFPVDTRGPQGRTALHLAAMKGLTDLTRMLLKHMTPFQRELPDAEGWAALHLATGSGRPGLSAMRVMAAGGCNVDVRAVAAAAAPEGCEGWTPLHCAVQQVSPQAVRLLVSRLGADPYAKDAHGRTPCDLAVALASAAREDAGLEDEGPSSGPIDLIAVEPDDGEDGHSPHSPLSPRGNGAAAGVGTSKSMRVLLEETALDPASRVPAFYPKEITEADALQVLRVFIRLLHEPVRLQSGMGLYSNTTPGSRDPASESTGTTPSRSVGAPVPGGMGVSGSGSATSLAGSRSSGAVGASPSGSVVLQKVQAESGVQGGTVAGAGPGAAAQGAGNNPAGNSGPLEPLLLTPAAPGAAAGAGVESTAPRGETARSAAAGAPAAAADTTGQAVGDGAQGGGLTARSGPSPSPFAAVKLQAQLSVKAEPDAAAADGSQAPMPFGSPTETAPVLAAAVADAPNAAGSTAAAGNTGTAAGKPIPHAAAGPIRTPTKQSPFTKPLPTVASLAAAAASHHPPAGVASAHSLPTPAAVTRPSPFQPGVRANGRYGRTAISGDPGTATNPASPAVSPAATAAAGAPLSPKPNGQPVPSASFRPTSDPSLPANGPHPGLNAPGAPDPVASGAMHAPQARGTHHGVLPSQGYTGHPTRSPRSSLSPTPSVLVPQPDVGACCVVSPINCPCGYSALNRAILLHRQSLADALLTTLPPRNATRVLLAGGTRGGGPPIAVNLAHLSTRLLTPAPSMATSKPMSPLNSLAHATLSTGGVASNAEPNATTSPMPATINAAALASTAAPSNSSSDSTRQRQLTPPPTPKPLQLQHHASEALGLAASTPKAPAQPSLTVLLRPPGFQTGASPNAPVPGLLAWEEATDTYRASAASQTSRVWLRWPGTPDPDSGWLLAELLVLQAGSSSGHVWLGLGPAVETPELLSSGGSLAVGSSSAAATPTSPATAAGHTHGHGHVLALQRAATAPGLVPAPGSRANGPGGASHHANTNGNMSLASALTGVQCPVMDNPLTHVVCIKDGQAFHGGAAAPMDVRLEARAGDTVAMFWNRLGKTAAFMLNGRYCGRLSGLQSEEQLAPVLGLQCGSFTFTWRCRGGQDGPSWAGDCAAVYSQLAAAGGRRVPLPPPGAYSIYANIDGMLVREQMMHEDQETPWMCKEPSMTSLHFAAWAGNVRVLPTLIRAKSFHPDEPDADGWTPLHFAAMAGHPEAVRLLLAHGARVNARTKYGSPPVMLAAKYGRTSDHVTCVSLLVEAGAELDVRDRRGRTLLILAARAGNLPMVQLLLDQGLDPSATDIHDREAQQYAGQHGAIFRLLRSAQASQKAAQHSKAAAAAKARAREQAAARDAAVAAATATAAAAGAAAAGGEVPQVSPRGVTAGGAEEEQEEVEEQSGSGVEAPAGRGSDALPPLLEQWQISPEHLVKGRLIEQGAFGAVYEGTWCGAKVAIKQLKGGSALSEREMALLTREVAIMRALPPHERIARMLGSVEVPGEGICLVMSFYPYTLQAVLQSERLRRNWLSPVRRASIARQLAEGLSFLHGLPGTRLIHRDLKPNNVLLEAPPSLDVKICDFGLSRILTESDVQSSSAAGHAFWMAPELLRALPYDEKVDVYAYGVILYQLAFWVDDQLYRGLNKAQVDFQVVHGMLRLQDRLPPPGSSGGVEPAVHELVYDCLAEEPRSRPDMATVLQRLAAVKEFAPPVAGAGGGAGAGAGAGGHGGAAEGPAHTAQHAHAHAHGQGQGQAQGHGNQQGGRVVSSVVAGAVAAGAGAQGGARHAAGGVSVAVGAGVAASVAEHPAVGLGQGQHQAQADGGEGRGADVRADA